jgi:threonine dehydratase
MLGARSITEFNYRFADPKHAHVFVGVQVHDRDETEHLVRELNANGLSALDFTHNEMAKLHVRHIVGGHAPQVEHELLYRFEFPERPGALLKFLDSMSHNWNISLFHYRNHGADYGRVLVGMQVPPRDKNELQEFLERVGYRYWDESENPAYPLFLG